MNTGATNHLLLWTKAPYSLQRLAMSVQNPRSRYRYWKCECPHGDRLFQNKPKSSWKACSHEDPEKLLAISGLSNLQGINHSLHGSLGGETQPRHANHIRQSLKFNTRSPVQFTHLPQHCFKGHGPKPCGENLASLPKCEALGQRKRLGFLLILIIVLTQLYAFTLIFTLSVCWSTIQITKANL